MYALPFVFGGGFCRSWTKRRQGAGLSEGIGRLIHIGVEGGRATRPGLKVGICGEHAGEPRCVDFCHRIGMDYVSCSPFRVPIARFAAARAAIRSPRKPPARKKKWPPGDGPRPIPRDAEQGVPGQSIVGWTI